MQSIIIGANQAGQRFDKYLHKCLPEATTGFLYKMLRKKNITLNGRKAEGKELLKEGDEVKLFFAEDTYAKLSGRPCMETDADKQSGISAGGSQIQQYREAYGALQGIAVLYEDAHVLILNKPAGILTQKAADQDNSLNEWMIGYLLDNGSITGQELRTFKPSVCNRLDRNTSGLVLCGKSLAGSQALSRIIHDRQVRKFYRTVVIGSLHKEELISGYLVKDEKTNTVKVFKELPSGGKNNSAVTADPIRTAYRPLHHSEVSMNTTAAGKFLNLTYIEVELITGKTHQIRAHLAGIGHPLTGDYKYGQKSVNDCFRKKYGLSYQLLHACRLEFPQLDGALEGLSNKTVIAPLPEQFTDILSDCGFLEV